ncbi:Hypothetical protein A7982_08259 [Minicystis rosea]|nr:Hypothetical protein A7982_08259 [Minicystis rosea]
MPRRPHLGSWGPARARDFPANSGGGSGKRGRNRAFPSRRNGPRDAPTSRLGETSPCSAVPASDRTVS